MNKSIKVALISALVFPGAGHLFLKKYLTGGILSVTTLMSLAVIISKAVEKARQIVEKIQLGDVQLDISAISELISKQQPGTDANLLDIASAVLIIVWLVGIVDSYRIARVQDRATQ